MILQFPPEGISNWPNTTLLETSSSPKPCQPTPCDVFLGVEFFKDASRGRRTAYVVSTSVLETVGRLA